MDKPLKSVAHGQCDVRPTDVLRSNSNGPESVREVSPEEEKEGYSGKDLWKRKVLAWSESDVVMGGDSGESIKQEMPS